ncbi:hypothetical protein BH11MYX3_BH11MYX3_04780 [soil metagenome]
MKRVIALLLVTIVACACPSKATKTGGGSGSAGSGLVEAPLPVNGCDGARAKVEQLYRAEAQAKEPKRVEEAVADNNAMVLAECAKDPTAVSACIAKVSSLKELETTCVRQLDDEGTEGDALKH